MKKGMHMVITYMTIDVVLEGFISVSRKGTRKHRDVTKYRFKGFIENVGHL
jgi:hypothetical protein